MFNADLSTHIFKKIHFIGIGGIGMSSLATLMYQLGWEVSGSDTSTNNQNIIKLQMFGLKIYEEHLAKNILSNMIIVYSSAIKNDNPEIIKAEELKLSIYKRATVLSSLMKMKLGVAIAGTHGKTTTTSILATIMQECGLEPSYCVGGIVKNLNGHARVGKGEYFVAEVDESDGSFLEFFPKFATITNIDNDHMDFYKTNENLYNSFLQFTNNIQKEGCITLNINDERLAKLAKESAVKIQTIGLNENADFYATNITYINESSEFDLYYKGEFQTKITLKLIGEHNILNALGAISLAFLCGLSFKEIALGVSEFVNVKRRMEVLFNDNDLKVIDDYAHHPTEIFATLNTLKEVYKEFKIVCIFEPHRFTRTKECWNEYLKCFSRSDCLYLSPIYSASEKAIPKITSEELVRDIKNMNEVEEVYFLKSSDEIEQVIENYKNTKTIIVTMGAGSIGSVVRKCLKL